MDLNEFAKEVHENAVAHGFWDEDRQYEEIIALIHSEWSEALEEYRAGRPLVWHNCDECLDEYGTVFCETATEDSCVNFAYREDCKYRGKAPEGIAVELIDGCIRILDLAAKVGVKVGFDDEIIRFKSLPVFVCRLHYYTALLNYKIGDDGNLLDGYRKDWAKWMDALIFVCFRFIRAQGLDPEAIMREKHEYNKTRPYKHGKVC